MKIEVETLISLAFSGVKHMAKMIKNIQRSLRQERVNRAVQRSIINYIRNNTEFNYANVTHVTISKDFRAGTVFVNENCLSDKIKTKEERKEQILKSFKENRISIQRTIADSIRLRYTPHLVFIWDKYAEEQDEVLATIESISDKI